MKIKERIAENKALTELLEWIDERYERAEYDIRRAKEKIEASDESMRQYYLDDIETTEQFERALEKLAEKVTK